MKKYRNLTTERSCLHPKLTIAVCMLLLSACGCKTPLEHRKIADQAAYSIIKQKQTEAFGKNEAFTLQRPSDLLRRRLLVEQDLLYSDKSSLGIDKLEKINHWPDPEYLKSAPDHKSPKPFIGYNPVKISLGQALQIGARNSFVYQTRKEDIFRSALRMDLEMNDFRNLFQQQFSSLVSSDSTGSSTVSGAVQTSQSGIDRKFDSGGQFTADLALDLVNLLTSSKATTLGIELDTSISIPLMRGSGKHIVREPLTQAERDVVYEIFEFERFKRTFAVDIAKEYLDVLRKIDQIKNSEENYRSLTFSVRRARDMAVAGELPEIQVDQALQDELRARNRWIEAIQSYENSLDSFKILIGLPADARIELDRYELEMLVRKSDYLIDDTTAVENKEQKELSADDDIELRPPGKSKPGPLEIDPAEAVKLAFDYRLDLRIAQGKIYDSQRDVVVTADDLRGELTLLGSARTGQRRSVGSAHKEDSRLRIEEAELFALLSIDLPVERTAERDEYRNSLINVDKTLRDKNLLEDQIKLEIRNGLRKLLSARESIQIQDKSVKVAQKRIESTNMFFESGRAAIREVLEAQDSLLSAQNGLTSAIVTYRVAELELQSDMGLLSVSADGRWREFEPSKRKGNGQQLKGLIIK